MFLFGTTSRHLVAVYNIDSLPNEETSDERRLQYAQYKARDQNNRLNVFDPLNRILLNRWRWHADGHNNVISTSILLMTLAKFLTRPKLTGMNHLVSNDNAVYRSIIFADCIKSTNLSHLCMKCIKCGNIFTATEARYLPCVPTQNRPVVQSRVMDIVCCISNSRCFVLIAKDRLKQVRDQRYLAIRKSHICWLSHGLLNDYIWFAYVI
jgi:hypothetical protein